MRKLPESREAVVAIQGGGVYGFSLLGQLQAVVDDHGYVPIAFAGTSAGAVVATLAWAGYRPDEIRDEFMRMAGTSLPSALRSLVGPIEPGHLAPETLGATFDELLATLTKVSSGSRWDLLCNANALLNLYKKLRPHYFARGFFAGSNLELRLEELIKARLAIPESILRKNEPVRFGHVLKYMRESKAAVYRPPLMLTVTNLTRRRLELISSFDAKYASVPIAKAVRASSGFPVFFTPSEMPECPDGGWFVDGGLVANFPIWAFSDVFRAQIMNSEARDLYGHLVPKPWLRIGLRTEDDVSDVPDLKQPKSFFISLGKMLLQDSRNQLEDVLAATASRPLVVRQPYAATDGPSHFLAITEVDAKKVASMYGKGHEFAKRCLEDLGSPGVFSKRADVESEVMAQLTDLRITCADILGLDSSTQAVRANVFLPYLSEDRQVNRLVFACNMEGHADEDMEFPDLESGATGMCYTTRRPVLCNLRNIIELRRKNPDAYARIFGMDPSLQNKVFPDQSLLVSVPIFDPHEVKHSSRNIVNPGTPRYAAIGHRIIDTEFDGPVLGVLNVDAALDYAAVGLSPDPNQHFSDRRVTAILAIIQGASFRIGEQLTEDFPRGGV